MVRLSDFLGGKGDKEKEESSAKPPRPPQSPTPPALSSPLAPPSLGPKSPPPSQPQVETVYSQLVEEVKRLFERARAAQPLDLAGAIRVIGQLPTTRVAWNERVLPLIEQQADEEHTLYRHSVNVACLANQLGRSLGYPASALQQVTLAGLLIDLGMVGEGEALAAQPRILSKEELAVVAQHPSRTLELLRDAQQISQKALDAIARHHVPAGSASGPSRGPDIPPVEYATILAVCDVYDALTHDRPHRQHMNPAQAMKMLIDGVEDQFDRRVVKALVDELSLYPRGSVVKLSTGELGIVERANAEAPLRPVVVIIRDAGGQRLTIPRRVNLLEFPFIYLKEIADEADL